MYTIGVDLGGTNIAVGLCDENLNIIERPPCLRLPSAHPSL
jgi:predicted NBD/HSP70 family sugar kinase